jgi:CheY-like chemotaxis protein
LSSPENPPIEATVGRGHAYGSARVLVVDDSPVNLMVMSALLESRGLETFVAADGAEAVAIASELRFDLVLMDLQMPVLDGLGATLAIRRIEGECSRHPVPVIAYTSTSPSAHVLEAHGMNGSLSKPCEDRDLEDCLARWCPSYCAAPPLRAVAQVKSGSQTPSRNVVAPC